MEGFLLKKGRGESKIFGRRNWKKRWFILEGQYLSYYEDFDRDNNIPLNKKGVAAVRGCEITVIPHQTKKYCFVMKHEHRRPVFLCADKEKLMFVWIDALTKAAKGIIPGPKTIDWAEYYIALNISPNEEMTSSSLNKAYRKAALRTHPDKGGSVDAFKNVQEAFEMLQSKLEEEEENKLFKIITFTARIVKSAPPVGLGMVVAENTKKGGITAKEIYPKIVIQELSPEAEGALKKGDVIVKIETDDITTWTMARVVQRLNDFRVPVSTAVKFTFERKVRIDGTSDEPEPQGEGESKGDQQTSQFKENIPKDPLSTPLPEDISDGVHSRGHRLSITSTDYSNHPYSQQQPEPEPEPEPDLNRNSIGHVPLKDSEHSLRSKSRLPSSASEPFHSHTGQLANLQTEIERLRRDLLTVIQQREDLRDELDDLRMKFEITIGERNEFLRQLADAELECQEMERRERDAFALVEQMSESHYLTAARFDENINMAINALHSGQLAQESLMYSQPGSVEFAQESALSAAALVDPYGKFKEPSSQTEGKGFLQRLEDSILKPYCDSAPPPPPPPTESYPTGHSKHLSQPLSVQSKPLTLRSAPPPPASSENSLRSQLPIPGGNQQPQQTESTPQTQPGNSRTFHQIHKRVVSGLYIDTPLSPSPSPADIPSTRKKSPGHLLAAKMRSSEPLPSQSPVTPQNHSQNHSHSQSYNQNISQNSSQNSPYFSRNTPQSHTTPPAQISSLPSRSLSTERSAHSSRTPNRRERQHSEPVVRSPGGGSGANRGPQFYRDMMLAASITKETERESLSSSISSLSPQAYKQRVESTADTYLFNEPSLESPGQRERERESQRERERSKRKEESIPKSPVTLRAQQTQQSNLSLNSHQGRTPPQRMRY